jgi:low temperature requirement protein LtrA
VNRPAHDAAHDTPETNDLAPPTPDQQPVQEQRATWLELFFDLIFVTAFDQLAQRLTKDDSLRGVGIFSLMFVAVWWAWVGNTIFAGRYGNEGAAYRWGTTLQLVSVGGLALGVLGDLKDVGAFFSVLYGVSRLILVGMYAVQARHAEDGPLALQRLRGFLPGALLWLLAAALPQPWQQLTWVVALGLDVTASLLHRHAQTQGLPHPEHLSERVGLLTIISLGAVITEIIGGAGAQQLRVLDQLPSVISLLITVALFKLYFDEARGLPVLLAHRDGRVGTLLVWLYAHLPLNLAITALGVGLGHGIAVENAKADQHEREVVAVSLSLVFLNLAALRLLTRHALSQLDLRRALRDRSVWAMSLGTLAVTALVYAPLSTLGHQAAVLAVCALALLMFWNDPVRGRIGETQEVVAQELHGEQPEEGGPPEEIDQTPMPGT